MTADSAHAGAAYGLGYALGRLGRYEEAGEAFRQILRVDSGSADGRNALAYVFAQTGDSLETAEALVEEALAIAPEMEAYWLDTLGWVRYRAGDYEGALRALLSSAQKLPNDDVSMRAENEYHLGVVLMALNRPNEARQYFERSRGRAKDEIWLPDLIARVNELGSEEEGET